MSQRGSPTVAEEVAIMRSSTRGAAPPGSRYGDQRPYTVVDRLDDLQGPSSGTIVLDRRLNWSGRTAYQLDNEKHLATMYETVLREASRPDDLSRWLNSTTLMRLWPALVLPPQVRRVWESRFPELMLGP